MDTGCGIVVGEREGRVDWRLVRWGAAILVPGVLVYVLARPPGSAVLMPRWLFLGARPPPPLAAVLGPLPTFLHTLAFCLLTVAVLRPGPRGVLVVCVGWFVVEAAFEVAQHPLLWAAPAPTSACCGGPPPTPDGWVARVLRGGTFDVFDLLAAAGGASLALWQSRKESV